MNAEKKEAIAESVAEQMTRESAKYVCEQHVLRDDTEYGCCLWCECERLKNELLRLERENEWIPVSERLPEVNVPVLLYIGGDDQIVNSNAEWAGRTYLGALTGGSGKFWSFAAHASGGPVHESVTHWRPLPQPPEREK